FYGPAHLFHFLFDRGSDSRIADVGVYLDKEIAADRHRLQLRVIDVRRDDSPAACDFITDKLGRDEAGNAGAEILTGMLEVKSAPVGVCRWPKCCLPAEVFPYCDELHLRRYDALFGVVHLGDGAPGSGLEREATAPWKRLQATPRFAERQPLCAL